MNEQITIVAGLGRCGSTMVMQMLHAGGIKPFADNLTSYETDKITLPLKNWKWLSDAEGCAFKLLHPFKLPIVSDKFSIIFLTRNHKQQAKSALKLLRELAGINSGRQDLREYERQLLVDENLYAKEMRKHDSGYLHLTFEGILLNPKYESNRIADKLNLPLDIDAMVNCVIKKKFRLLILFNGISIFG